MTTVYRTSTAQRALKARVTVPGSKSVANRALICAALADGVTHLRRLPDGDDSAALVAALAALGVGIDASSAGDLAVTGGRSRWTSAPVTLDSRLAGTTSRFLTALGALSEVPITIDGGAPLRARPMAVLHDALVALGARLHCLGQPGALPVVVEGLRRGGHVEMPGRISSQFLSALMMIAPYLDGGLSIRLTSPLVSRPYVAMTAAVMEQFGHGPTMLTDDEIVVTAGRYRATEVHVEADASSASYPLAAAAIVGGQVVVSGLSAGSLQGDARFVGLLEQMGAEAVDDAGDVGVRRGAALHGIDVDMADISDLVPSVAAVALFADSPTTIRGVGFIRGKESDRLGDLAAELGKLGASVEVTDDGLRIEPAALHGARLCTHHDHRLAMAFGVIGLAVDGVEVEDPGVVSKSWPDYWAMIEAIR